MSMSSFGSATIHSHHRSKSKSKFSPSTTVRRTPDKRHQGIHQRPHSKGIPLKGKKHPAGWSGQLPPLSTVFPTTSPFAAFPLIGTTSSTWQGSEYLNFIEQDSAYLGQQLNQRLLTIRAKQAHALAAAGQINDDASVVSTFSSSSPASSFVATRQPASTTRTNASPHSPIQSHHLLHPFDRAVDAGWKRVADGLCVRVEALSATIEGLHGSMACMLSKEDSEAMVRAFTHTNLHIPYIYISREYSSSTRHALRFHTPTALHCLAYCAITSLHIYDLRSC